MTEKKLAQLAAYALGVMIANADDGQDKKIHIKEWRTLRTRVKASGGNVIQLACEFEYGLDVFI